MTCFRVLTFVSLDELKIMIYKKYFIFKYIAYMFNLSLKCFKLCIPLMSRCIALCSCDVMGSLGPATALSVGHVKGVDSGSDTYIPSNFEIIYPLVLTGYLKHFTELFHNQNKKER